MLDDDGLAALGEIIGPSDVYVNKQSPIIMKGSPLPGIPDSAYRPCRQVFKGSEGEPTVQEDFPFSACGISGSNYESSWISEKS
uniref:Uncharacterized protein n=1 Tax=Cucumis sativus TaxID=3659 RepID=A0A0A0M0Z5_CUCSA